MESGITAATKDMEGLEVYIRGAIPLDLSEKLTQSIENITLNSTNIELALSGALFGQGSRGKAISPTGSLDDLKKGGLINVIPNGFLLLHNDIIKLAGDSSETSEGGSSKGTTSFLSDFVKGFAGAAGVAAGAAAALALFNGGSGPSDSLREVIDAVDADMHPEDYIEDPEVIETKRKAVLGYLKMYYAGQIASLAGEAIGNTAASAITSLVEGTFGKLINFIKGKEDSPEATSLEAIVNELDRSLGLEDLGLAEGGEHREMVVKEKRIATVAYLTAYYVGQVTSAIGKGAAGAVADTVSELVGGTLNKLYKKLTGQDVEASSLEAFVKTLDGSMTLEELGLAAGGEHREAVVKEKRLATVAYLTAYYTGQVTSAMGKAVAGAIGDTVAELVGGTLRKLFNKLKGDDADTNSLEGFVKVLDKEMSLDELGLSAGGENRDKITKVQTNAVVEYLKAYYAAQTDSLIGKNMGASVGESAAEAVKGFFTGLFGKKKDSENSDPFLTSVQTIIDNVGATITPERFTYDKNASIKAAVDESVAGYVKVFLDEEKKALIESIDSANLKEAARAALSKLNVDLTPLASLAFSATSPESNVTINSTYNDSALLSKIDSVIDTLVGLASVLQNSSGSIIINNTTPVEDEFRMAR